MFRAISETVTRRARPVVALWAILIALGAGWSLTGFGSQGLFDRLAAGDLPTIPGTESQAGNDILADRGSTGATVTAVVRGVDLTDPALVQAAGADIGPVTAEVMEVEDVEQVVSPFVLPAGPADPQAAPLVSADEDGFLVTVTLEPDLPADAESTAHDEVVALLEGARFPALADAPGGPVEPEVRLTSTDLIASAVLDQVQRDLVTGEAVSLPLALLIMVVVFGGFLAAGLPLIGAMASIATGMGALLAATHLMTLESFVMTVVTVLGLGLSIDYGLLIVSRFREEIRTTREALDANGGLLPGALRPDASRGRHAAPPPDVAMSEQDVVHRAVRRSVLTAGRTVVFSALTVAISVAGLLFMRPDILRSISAGGVIIVLLAVLASVTLVPALMTLIGRRLLRPPVLGRVPGLRVLVRGLGDAAPAEGVFSRLARRVQRHPWLVLLGVLAILAVLMVPLKDMTLRNSGIGMLPPHSDLRDTYAIIQNDFPAAAYPEVQVLAEAAPEDTAGLVADIEAVAGVETVSPGGVLDDGYVMLSVFTEGDDAGGPIPTEVVREIRGLDPGYDTWVLGEAASQIDFTASLLDGLPVAAGVVVVATFVLLFLMTGSVLIPVKALLMNIVSMAATLGVTTWIFEGGHGGSLLGFEPVGGLETYVVAVIVAFGFGLAMDYEVFLLSRIKEHWDEGNDNDSAVVHGLQRSGRIITSAALIIVAVFLGFAFGELTVIKQVAVGLAVAVLIDATLVRMLLVPATMTLLGRWNWWAPRRLRGVYRRFAIEH